MNDYDLPLRCVLCGTKITQNHIEQKLEKLYKVKTPDGDKSFACSETCAVKWLT